jgi:dTMP kinase
VKQAGVLIALEGIDGSGKGTQARLLKESCESAGISCSIIGFPRYGQTPFSEAISEYLNGAYGGVSEVHPKLVSILFAADRFAVKDKLENDIRENGVVICDRYVASNMAHQAAKLPQKEREEFVQWLEEIEYQVFGLPMAGLTVFLDMPAENAQQFVHQKSSREVGVTTSESGQGGYTSLSADIHESDLGYLKSCRDVYLHLCAQGLGGRWSAIPCVKNNEVSPIDEIAKEVWREVRAVLTTSPLK